MQSAKLILKKGTINLYVFFFTYYTNINYGKLKFVRRELINFCLKKVKIRYKLSGKELLWLEYLWVQVRLHSWHIFFIIALKKKLILKLEESNLHRARSFNNTFRFIDDLCAINGNDLFEKHFKKIFPEN